MRRLLAVDPGVGGTGWALFINDELKQVGCCSPKNARAPWVKRQADVVRQLSLSVNTSTTGTVVIECPELQTSAKGWASARRGDLVKLALITGAIVHVFRSWEVELVTPFQWKGVLPKRITMKAVREEVPASVRGTLRLDSYPDHTWDAVGIGLWYLDRRG